MRGDRTGAGVETGEKQARVLRIESRTPCPLPRVPPSRLLDETIPEILLRVRFSFREVGDEYIP
jgi:hypothetical protein